MVDNIVIRTTTPRSDGATESSPAADTTALRPSVGGRTSLDTEDSFFGAFRVVQPPPSAESAWRTLTLDAQTLDRMPSQQLMQLLADLSPDISRALWDFLRMANPGWEIVTFIPGTEEPAPQAQARLDTFFALLADLYGSFDVIVGRLFIGAFLRGALMAELVLDGDGRIPVDLATPDPSSARFQRVTDPVRGVIWQLGQWQRGGFLPLDRPTVRYLPLDPLPGSPYGRAMAAPALFSSVFLIGLLHDLRRVVSQQGYPRLDLILNLQQMYDRAPADVQQDPEAWQTWVNDTLAEIKQTYAQLQPDDAFVHTDIVSVNKPVGTVDAQSLGAVDSLLKNLERMTMRGLKSTPLLFAGGDGGTSEANANRQWEVYAASIKSVQHLCENLLERLFSLALQAQGIVATVQFRFAELRAAELYRDEQTRQLKNANTFAEYAAGWISQDEAAQATVGHAPDQDVPRAWPSGPSSEVPVAPPPTPPSNPDPGSNRTPLRVIERT